MQSKTTKAPMSVACQKYFWLLMGESQSLTALTVNRAFVLFKLLDKKQVKHRTLYDI